jgi:hypothetical protein
MGIQNGLCPVCRAPIPRELKKGFTLEKDPFEGGEPPLWQYESREAGRWWDFLPARSEEIEVAYQAMIATMAQRLASVAGASSRGHRGPHSSSSPAPILQTVSILVRGKPYIVDLGAMTQRAPDGSTRRVKRRDPKRDPEGVKGVAGGMPKRAPTP